MRNVHRFEDERPRSFQLVTRSQKIFHHFLIMIVEGVSRPLSRRGKSFLRETKKGFILRYFNVPAILSYTDRQADHYNFLVDSCYKMKRFLLYFLQNSKRHVQQDSELTDLKTLKRFYIWMKRCCSTLKRN